MGHAQTGKVQISKAQRVKHKQVKCKQVKPKLQVNYTWVKYRSANRYTELKQIIAQAGKPHTGKPVIFIALLMISKQ